MKFIRNLLATIGLLTIILFIGGYIKARLIIAEFDRQMIPTYQTFAEKLLQTKDPGNAMVLVVPVDAGLSLNDVKESIKSLAHTNNIFFVGENHFSKHVEAVTGQPYRDVILMSFCDAHIGKMMIDYNSIYAAFMPCRIAIVQRPNGELQLYTMRLDILLHGGKPLPRELENETSRLWNVLQEIMHGAAKGDF